MTCLRSLKFNLHPKLALINGRRSTSHTSLPKVAHSSFLNEFLDNHVERTTHFRCPSTDLPTLSRIGITTYDPALHMDVKPLVDSLDDIVLPTRSSSMLCNHLSEDDLYNDIIQRENYPVIVLLGSASMAMQEAAVWSAKATPNVDSEKGAVLSAGQSGKGLPRQDPGSKPTEEQLVRIQTRLTETLPDLFVRPLDYSFYNTRVVFENNIRGVTTVGISRYVVTMSLLRMVGHFKFAYVKLDLLKVTKHSEDGTIRIRWRIKGVPARKAMLQFWKFRLWNYDTVKDMQVDWFDGISTFYVSGEGQIVRHVCDKMMPDEDKLKTPSPMAAKLALFLGVLLRPPMEMLYSCWAAKLHPQLAKQPHSPIEQEKNLVKSAPLC